MATETGNQFASYPPSTFDRADGSPGQPGTPDTNDDGEDGRLVLTADGDTGDNAQWFEELPDSPTIERAEQGTIVHRFNCDPSTAQTLIATIGRGYTLEDSFGNQTRVVNARMSYIRGKVCILEITAESLNFDLPPDEFSLGVTELNPALTKHPRYNLLTYRERQLVTGANLAEAPEFASMYTSIINNISDISHQQQAQELALKYHRGEDSFYLPGFRIEYSQFFAFPIPLNPGGYIEDPIGSNNLPYYFWNTDNPQTNNTNNTIFSQLEDINPTIYQGGISWLRLLDTIQYQRTWFKITKSWQGAPIGHWDNELYNQTPQAYQTSEDQGTVLTP